MRFLVYADDFILLARTREDIAEMMHDVLNALREHNLDLAPDKCAWASTAGGEGPMSFGGHDLTPLDPQAGFVFLGCTITLDGRTSACTAHKIDLGWSKFWSLKHVWSRKHLNHDALARYVDTMVGGVVLHGAGILTLSQADLLCYRTAQLALYRKAFKLSRREGEPREDYHIRSAHYIRAVLVRCNIPFWHHKVAQLCFCWAGHVYRMPQQRSCRRVFLCRDLAW